jgi:diguanylate cyclase (GGDEF)-like protein
MTTLMAPKILVVDDEMELERLIRQRFRKQIQAQELDFLFATDGNAALDYLQERQVDMVLTDLNMPQMDGFTFLGQLPAVDQALRAVVVSAYSDMPNIRRAMNKGAFDFLTKPIDFRDLEITIWKTLEEVRQVRQARQQMQQAQQQLLQAAYHDALTGLSNRNGLLQRLTQLEQSRAQINAQIDSQYSQEQCSQEQCSQEQCSQEQCSQELHVQPLYALLFIDLDGFKAINDSFSHSMGDLLLQCAAQRIKGCLREADSVARLGGDEFAVVLIGLLDQAEAVTVAQRIQEQFKTPFKLGDIEVRIGASIGLALNQGQGNQTPADLLHNADVAMYCAKTQRQGNLKVFHSTMQMP